MDNIISVIILMGEREKDRWNLYRLDYIRHGQSEQRNEYLLGDGARKRKKSRKRVTCFAERMGSPARWGFI